MQELLQLRYDDICVLTVYFVSLLVCFFFFPLGYSSWGYSSTHSGVNGACPVCDHGLDCAS